MPQNVSTSMHKVERRAAPQLVIRCTGVTDGTHSVGCTGHTGTTVPRKVLLNVCGALISPERIVLGGVALTLVMCDRGASTW